MTGQAVDWILKQAETASPFAAGLCLIITVLLWRQLQKEWKTREIMWESFVKLATTSAVAIERGSHTVELAVREIRETNQAIHQLRETLDNHVKRDRRQKE